MASSKSSYKVFPKGFLSSVTNYRYKPKRKPLSNILERRHLTIHSFTQEETIREGDSKIDSLYESYIVNPELMNSHEFREKVFKNAFRLIPDRDFFQWYSIQKLSPLYGQYQGEFLKDTIRFLEHGYRKMSVVSWNDLISTAPVVETNIDPLDDEVKRFFTKKTSFNKSPRDLVGILQLWWSRDNGVVDLLLTLNILFGSIK